MRVGDNIEGITLTVAITNFVLFSYVYKTLEFLFIALLLMTGRFMDWIYFHTKCVTILFVTLN